MSEAMMETADNAVHKAGLLSRGFALLYAGLAYGIGAGSLFWFLFIAMDLLPISVAGYEASSLALAFLVDVALVLLFAVQHTIMARSGFKAWFTRVIPSHLERATYVLASGILLLLILLYWQPLPGTVWQIENAVVSTGLQALCAIGFAYLLLASFFTNHFELFGLRQAWLHATGRPYTELEFRKNWIYGFSRHPLMAGMLVVLWSTADMTMTRFALALLMTIYLFIGIRFEERSLIQQFGDSYRQYAREVGMFFTIGK